MQALANSSSCAHVPVVRKSGLPLIREDLKIIRMQTFHGIGSPLVLLFVMIAAAQLTLGVIITPRGSPDLATGRDEVGQRTVIDLTVDNFRRADGSNEDSELPFR
ncbi:hypothetical protein PtB15_6B662 [Puccinia triticina]|nr:hypothetical protein PtB15_6B662 [Puccinia triticina]